MLQELHRGHSFASNHITSLKMMLGEVDSIESLAPSWSKQVSKQSDEHDLVFCFVAAI